MTYISALSHKDRRPFHIAVARNVLLKIQEIGLITSQLIKFLFSRVRFTMQRGITGQYDVLNVGDEEVRAFIPNILPPQPPVELVNSRQRLLERAQLALGRLDSITVLLPDPDLFLYAYVRREAVLSSQIEGTPILTLRSPLV